MQSLEVWQLTVLALIQGLTEFLPISSAAHIQLPSLLLGWEDQGLLFDVATHGGSLFAVLLYYRQRLFALGHGAWLTVKSREMNNDSDYLLKLAVATVPIVLIGFFLQDLIELHTRQLGVIAITTFVFAILLGLADKKPKLPLSDKRFGGISFRDAALIGCAQVFALIPGTSRSGVTITCALFLGLSRTQSAHFAFLLGVPTITGAFLLMVSDAGGQIEAMDLLKLSIAFVIAFASTFLCIDVFLRFIERIGMMPFVIYRILLAVLLGALVWL